jgi:hypothetical protein
MAKYVLSPKRLSLSHSEFDKTISGKSKETKARYEREWKRYNEKEQNKSNKATVQNNGKVKQNREETTRSVARSSSSKTKYPISAKRLDVSYDQAKKDFAKYSPRTQKRYWSAWQKYEQDHKDQYQKEHPDYRLILKVKAKADGETIEYYSASIVHKKRLSKSDLKAQAEQLQLGTNVKIISVDPVEIRDNWTGKKV